MSRLEREENKRNALRSAVNKFSNGYNNYMEEVIRKIYAQMEQGNSIKKAVKHVSSEKGFMSDEMNSRLAELLNTAIDLGYGKKLPTKTKERLLDIALSKAWAPDDMPLKTRIKRFSTDIKLDINQTMYSLTKQLSEINRMVNDIEKIVSSKQVDKQKLSDQCKKLRTVVGMATGGNRVLVQDLYTSTQSLTRSVGGESRLSSNLAMANIRNTASQVWEHAIPNSLSSVFKGKALYKAERIARTEASRVWFESFIARHQSNDKIFGYRWLLSPRHKIYDQCDVCANINIGYGKGIYPKNLIPSIPRHPHCMCTLRVVYHSQVKSSATLDMGKAKEYINKLSSEQAQDLFGVEGAQEVLLGADWQKHLRGWNGLGKPEVRLNIEN